VRYGELFAGAGGMSLGLERAGMSCAFHAELADFPRRVLSHRWPNVPLYGDVATLNGRTLVRSHGEIDLLAGGSPCQDMSVAGKRAGLAGARSGLFYEQLRLWEETRATYLLWENVAGALSSNAGADFAAVLSAIVGAAVHVPSDGWRGAGVVSGPGAVAAWRLLDAQWFGVPQRRLRVFVLGARAGGVDPAQVLLEPEGVRRHPPTRGEAGQGSPRGTDERAGEAGGVTLSFKSGQSEAAGATFVTNEFAPTLQAQNNGSNAVPAVLSFGWQNSAAQGDDATQGSVAPLRTTTTPAVLAWDGEGNAVDDVAGSLNAHHSSHRQPGVIIPTLSPGAHNGAPGQNGQDALQHAEAMFAVTGIPRRLMPIECERLMSWPDGWTDVPDEKGKPASDAARYKACGNGVVSSVAEWIGERLKACHVTMVAGERAA
jgi:DNA (cytosine-5)-methyltransferase 1